MSNVELYIDNKLMKQWSDWRSVRINVERNEETWNVSSILEGIELYGADAQAFIQSFEVNPYRRIAVRLQTAGLVLAGFVDYTSVRVGQGRVVLSANLDEKTQFEREIAGQLIRPTGTMRVSIERQIDEALAAAYIVAAAFYLETAIRNIIQIKRDVADVIAHAAQLAPGSAIASVKLAVVKILLRAIYTAIVIIALSKLLQMLIKLIPEPKQVKYAKVTEAIQRICTKAGYKVVFPEGAEKIFVFGNTIDTIEVVELIKTLQTITNTRLHIRNKTLRFEPRRVTPFPLANRAYVEFYRLNVEEIFGREVISLARDPADFHADNLNHNVEIILDEARGFKRTIIPFAPARSKVKLSVLEAVLNELQEFFRKAWIFSQNRSLNLRFVSNIPVVQDITFLPRIIYTNSISIYTEADEAGLLKYIEKNYKDAYKEAKQYDAKMFLSLKEFQALSEANYPGVVRMVYTPATETAEITYELPASFATRERRTVIA